MQNKTFENQLIQSFNLNKIKCTCYIYLLICKIIEAAVTDSYELDRNLISDENKI